MLLDSRVDENLALAVQQLLPGYTLTPASVPTENSSEPLVYIDLPAATGADYFFRAWVRPERQIHAILPRADASHTDFWYMPFEAAEFRNSIEDLDRTFVRVLKQLLSNETRIVQTRGLFFENFRCELKSAGGWKKINAMGMFRRGGFNVPIIQGRKHIYRSSPVSNAVDS